MRPKLILGLALLPLVLSVFVGQAFASCAGPLSIELYQDRADLVVTGTVQDSGLPGHYNFSVATYFKGQGPQVIKVSGTESTVPGLVTSVDFTFTSGDSYLLFLQAGADSIYRTNQCDGSRGFQDDLTEEEIAVLGTGSTPPPPDPTPTLWQTKLFAVAILVSISAVLLLKRHRHRHK